MYVTHDFTQRSFPSCPPPMPMGEYEMSEGGFNRQEVVDALKEFIGRYSTQEEAARDLDISRVYLWRILNFRKPPSNKVLEKLGFRREIHQYEVYYKDQEIQALSK